MPVNKILYYLCFNGCKSHQRQYASHGFRADSSLLCVCVFVSDSGKSGRARGILVYFHCLWAIFFFLGAHRCLAQSSAPGMTLNYDTKMTKHNKKNLSTVSNVTHNGTTNREKEKKRIRNLKAQIEQYKPKNCSVVFSRWSNENGVIKKSFIKWQSVKSFRCKFVNSAFGCYFDYMVVRVLRCVCIGIVDVLLMCWMTLGGSWIRYAF